jgi:hypothetical protein
MTLQAVVGLPEELGFLAGLLVKGVEDHAQVRIHHRNLKDLAVLTKSDVDIIVEIERAGS